MSGVLVYSEREALARELLAFAAAHRDALGRCDAVVLGEQSASRAEALAGLGAGRIYTYELGELSDETLAGVLARLAEQLEVEYVLLGATRRGRSLAPRLAEMLNAGCVTEAVQVGLDDGQLITSRFTLGGNTLARERILTERKVMALVPGAASAGFSPGGTVSQAAGAAQIDNQPAGGAAQILPLPFDPPAQRSHIVRRDPKPDAGADLAGSQRLVCIGRGLQKAEDLPVVQELADALDAELACTRPLSYEYGWLPEERMIGISGQRTSPRLMLSLGVSGQVQHTVGITGSKVIVAVNQEASAPIFKLADYGIVGDLYQVAPRLAERLRQRSAG